jgi:hypothetical protein
VHLPRSRSVLWIPLLVLGAPLGYLVACGELAEPTGGETVGRENAALTLLDGGVVSDPVPCAAWAYAALANTGNIVANSGSVVDSYQSSLGAYGGTNVGRNAVVQAAGTISNNGGIIKGTENQGAAGGFSVIPAPANAINLPLGSPTPGSLNINTASGSITLPPGDYVASNINVNFPGAINLSPAGPVRIWVTGTLNLGGNENLNGIPDNLAFLVTSAGYVNVNSNGSLFGMIYAPTSTINVDSSIYGSVLGGLVSLLNSEAAIHYDQSSSCAQATSSNTPSGPRPLPPPPTSVGCYLFTLNGWLQVQCSAPTSFMPGFHSFDTSQDGLQELSVAPPDGGRAEVPLVYGQIESAVLSLASETNVNAAGNATDGSAAGWSIQNNTNVFYCNGSGDYCFDQFVLVGNGTSGMSGVCIETWDLTTVVSTNYCVGVDGTTVTSTFGEEYNIISRDAGLQAGDFGNVAAYAYAGADGGALIAAVGQFSWVSNQDVVPSSETNLPNRVPGLYAVVAPDAYGLANGWTNVSGGLMGYNSSSRSLFSNAEVATRFAASDCPGDVAASGPICPASPSLSSRSDFTWSTQGQQSVFLTVKSGTAESNNLADTRDASVSYPNQNLVVAESLSTTQVVPNGAAYASCLSAQQNHLFIRDFEGDLGGVPSNVGNVPYWESPDIFIVPAEAGAPDAGSFSGDLELTAGAPYNVYLQVHNDFGCSDVTGPVKVLIDLANPDMGFENWQPVTAGAQLGHYIGGPGPSVMHDGGDSRKEPVVGDAVDAVDGIRKLHALAHPRPTAGQHRPVLRARDRIDRQASELLGVAPRHASEAEIDGRGPILEKAGEFRRGAPVCGDGKRAKAGDLREWAPVARRGQQARAVDVQRGYFRQKLGERIGTVPRCKTELSAMGVVVLSEDRCRDLSKAVAEPASEPSPPRSLGPDQRLELGAHDDRKGRYTESRDAALLRCVVCRDRERLKEDRVRVEGGGVDVGQPLRRRREERPRHRLLVPAQALS